MMESAGGRYKDIIPLGRGGMGDVTLAVLQGPSGFNKLQVIKRLRTEISDNSEFLEMFLHEARLAARLSHPNVVQTNEVGREGDFFFIAMEYLEGQTLHAIFRKSRRGSELHMTGPLSDPTPLSGALNATPPPASVRGGANERQLPINVGLRIIVDVLEGLHYAHELVDDSGQPMRLVHRDVSPGNVFVSYDGTVRLLDFGIAKAADSQLQTRTGILKGKVPYMAPEQFRSRNVDRRCDLYAVGAILWELAAGVRLWHGLSDLEIVTHLSTGGAASPRTVNPDVHPKLEAICLKALALNADDRYSTAAELQADVEALLRELGGATTRSVGKYVSTLFAQKRAQQQSVIESKLREFRQAQGLTASSEISGPRSAARLTTSTLDLDGGPRFSRSVQMQAARTTGGLTAPSFAMPAPQQRRVGPWLVAAGALVLVLAVGGTYWAVRETPARPPSGTPTADPQPSVSVVPSAAPTTPVVAKTRLFVQASPADTKLFLDDAPLVVNPYTGELVRDGLSHRIRGEANGFEPETKLVPFVDEKTNVHIELKRKKKK